MKRNTSILIGLFVLLAAAAVLVLQKPGEHSAVSDSSGPMFQIDSVAVDKITIQSPRDSVELEKRGAEWFVSQPVNCRADQESVGRLVHEVKSMENKGTVSNKPEKYPVFQVDRTGIQVRIFEKGAEKASFVLGKMAASYVDSYARTLNSSDVLLIGGANSYMFDRPVKDWRDKSIFTTPKESITAVRYQYGDTVFTLALKDSTWSIGTDRAQQSAVDALLSSLSAVQADDFVDSAIAPKISSIVSYAGVQCRFSFDKSLNKYRVQSSQSPQWYIMEPWRANQILKRKKDLLAMGGR